MTKEKVEELKETAIRTYDKLIDELCKTIFKLRGAYSVYVYGEIDYNSTIGCIVKDFPPKPGDRVKTDFIIKMSPFYYIVNHQSFQKQLITSILDIDEYIMFGKLTKRRKYYHTINFADRCKSLEIRTDKNRENGYFITEIPDYLKNMFETYKMDFTGLVPTRCVN